MPQDIRIARGEKLLAFPFASPLSKYLTINDLMAHDIDDSDYFTDTWSEQLLVNHNIYTYHRYSIDACNMVFGEEKNHANVPPELLEIVGLVDRYFEEERADRIIPQIDDLLESMRRQDQQTLDDQSDTAVS